MNNLEDFAGIAELPRVLVDGFAFPATLDVVGLRHAAVIPTKVDLVYTWLDGSRPHWLSSRALYLKQQNALLAPDGLITGRYTNRDELLYSLRSALLYMRGVRKIYIVTNGDKPRFLDSAPHPLLHFVDHRDIFSRSSDLPTFNSHAIEANIHRIEGLSEHYLYLNDDVFFGRGVSPLSFFDEYGRSRYFVWRNGRIPGGPVIERELSGTAAAKNARRIIQDRFGVYIIRKFLHTPIALMRSVVAKMQEELPEEFLSTSSSRLRQTSDVAISGSLYFHYATCIGKASEGTIRHSYMDVNAKDFSRKFMRTLGDDKDDSTRFDTFCVNDTHDGQVENNNTEFFRHEATRAYPTEAPFETSI